jgi:hypothetical protein
VRKKLSAFSPAASVPASPEGHHEALVDFGKDLDPGVRHYQPRRVLFEEGDPADGLSIVLSGALGVVRGRALDAGLLMAVIEAANRRRDGVAIPSPSVDDRHCLTWFDTLARFHRRF